MRERMEENERLLRERLEESGERRLVLPGGFAVARASEAERPTLEVEAEGTAYAVLSYFGVDASGYSFAYVAHWAEQKEVVKAVLSNIQKTARAIIEVVENGASEVKVTADRGAA